MGLAFNRLPVRRAIVILEEEDLEGGVDTDVNLACEGTHPSARRGLDDLNEVISNRLLERGARSVDLRGVAHPDEGPLGGGKDLLQDAHRKVVIEVGLGLRGTATVELRMQPDDLPRDPGCDHAV